MEKMGIIENTTNGWLLTDEGRKKYTGWIGNVFNPNVWKPEIVKDIADFFHKNHIDEKKINRKW